VTSRQQWGLATGGWFAYVIYYLGRTNLSVAVPGLESEGGLGPQDIGLLVASFFWVYSLTQVIVGQLADRFGSRWLVGVGLVGSGVMNALFIHSGSFSLALIWWSLNGMFQGLGWPPLIAGLSRWLTGPRAAQASAAYGTSYVAGTVLTLAAGGFIVAWGGTAAVFNVAAVVLIVAGIIWFVMVRDPVPRGHHATRRSSSMLPTLWLMPAAALVGVGWMTLVIWTPEYLTSVLGMSISSAGLNAAAMAAVSLPVMVLVSLRFRSAIGRRSSRIAGAVIVITGLSFLLVPWSQGDVWVLGAFALATSLANASSSIVLGFLPRVSAPERVGLASGIFSLSFSVGGGFGALIIGGLIGEGSWGIVYFVAGAASVLGALWVFLWSMMSDRPTRDLSPLRAT
jgi:sugar phosphate permease